jgi:hypothetical protein
VNGLVVLFGIAIAALGAVGIASPARLLALVRWESQRGVYLAAGIRLALGAVLLLAAPELRQPALARIFGAIALLGGVGTALMGRTRFGALVGWWERQPAWRARAASAFATGFGALLAWLGAG